MTESTSDGYVIIEVDSKTKPRILELRVRGRDIINFKVTGGKAAITVPVRGRFLEGCSFSPNCVVIILLVAPVVLVVVTC